jgi:hypothetical protein
MGAVITFPQVRRSLWKTPTRLYDTSAAIIILPVIRIERICDAPSGTETETTKSPSGRKRRRRATRR